MRAYGVINKDKKVYAGSSSGGAFSLFATAVLRQGGIVFGVSMSDDCYSARHVYVDRESDLFRLRGSKYLQSNLGNCFNEVKDYLTLGRTVLFSGTPCQVGALKLFLRREYDNLITVEVVCHGTPPQRLWQQYALYLENKYQSKIKKIYFRDEMNVVGGGISNEN